MDLESFVIVQRAIREIFVMVSFDKDNNDKAKYIFLLFTSAFYSYEITSKSVYISLILGSFMFLREDFDSKSI